MLRALLDEAPEPVYGALVVDLVDVSPGSIYGVLDRLEVYGWVRSWWEDEAVAEAAGRRRRRLFELEAAAVGAARSAVEEPSKSLWRRLVVKPL